MRKKMLEEIISDYGIDGNVVNDLAKAIREYYKDVVWSEKFHKESAETLQSKLLELEATSEIRAVGSKTTILNKMNWIRRGEDMNSEDFALWGIAVLVMCFMLSTICLVKIAFGWEEWGYEKRIPRN